MKKSFFPAILWMLIFILSGCGGGGEPNNATPTVSLASISIAPATPGIIQGGTLQLAATGTFADDTTVDITSDATWASTDTTKATVTSAGLVTGTGLGTSTIEASYGGKTNSTLLTVTAVPVAPAITTQPANRSVTAGQTATFNVAVSGTLPITYQWRKNGANVGTSSASYTTPDTILADSGAGYSVVVSNSAGNVTSNNATLTVTASSSFVADYRVATEATLRAIPDSYINTARTTLHVAYNHTSHGTHVSYGAYGLPDYKTGDATKFGITRNTAADPSKLDFHDNEIGGAYSDLSTADANWSAWRDQVRVYLDNPANAAINVMMWSWCDISGHSVPNYLSSMQTLINEYGAGGTKIGTGGGHTRTTAVTFIFMTGHANPNNSGNPRDQAALITDYCNTHGYFCIDYYSIDTHAMNDTYYADTGDNGNSASYGGNFYQDWQDSHTLDVDWYENRYSPGGSATPGEHNTQHITANRKAYAFWWVLARIAGY